MILKMLTKLEKKIWINTVKTSDENIRKFQTEVTELKNTTTELKNNQWGSKARFDEAEERIRELETWQRNSPNQSSKRKRMQNGEDSLKDLWDNIKCINYHIIEESQKKIKKGKKTI